MFYEIYTKGNYQVIRINEVIGLGSDITELDDIIVDLLNKDCINVAIHFQDGSYLYSGSAAVVVRCWEAIQEKDGCFALININDDILDFLTIMGLDAVIGIYNSDKELEDVEQD